MPRKSPALSADDDAPESAPQTQVVRRRVRKKRRRQRPERRTWLWAPLLGGGLVLALVIGGLLVRDVLLVRDSLQAAQDSLEEVRDAAGEFDVEEAERALTAADEQLAVARNRTGGPLWSVGARLPVLDDSVAVTRRVVSVASAAIDIAHHAIDDGSPLLAGGLNVDVDDGNIDLTPLHEARQLLDDLPTSRLEEQRQRLADLEIHWVPQQVADGRADTLRMAQDALDTIEAGRALLAAMPTFLGEQEPRRYFLGMQTSAELRGTGGMIGYWAVLEVQDGAISLSEAAVHDPDDLGEGGDPRVLTTDDGDPATAYVGALGGDPWDGVPVPEEFAERYGHVAAAGLFNNINVDPHLPTTAPVILDLFEERTGERLDGVVLVDPVGLQRILQAIGGALELPEELAVDGIPASLPPEEFARFALVDVYETYGAGRTAERREVVGALGDAAFDQLFGGAWDGLAVSRAMGHVAGERHLQVFVDREEEQPAFERVGAGGAMPHDPDRDLLAVTANNSVGGKQDVHVGHRVAADIALGAPRRTGDDRVEADRTMTVGVGLDNTLSSEGRDLYILGNCSVDASGCFDGPPGWNRTWFSVWGPEGGSLQDLRGDGRGSMSGTIHGHHVVDRFLDTAPESSNGFEVELQATTPLRIEDGALVYELAWWSQAKAIPDLLDVTVTAPDGWRIRDLTVAGGGEGLGMGPHGEGQPLAVEAEGSGSSARVTGTVSADATIRVELVGAGG